MLLKKRNLIAFTTVSCLFMLTLASTSYAQETDSATFHLGIINNSSHTLTYQQVKATPGSTCNAFVNKKSLNPGDGFVAVQSMLGAKMLSCFYTFTTEEGALVSLQVANPTYIYFRVPSYSFHNDNGISLSTLYTPEAYPVLPRNLMHKSASLTINPF